MQEVNIGAAPNDNTGDPLRTAFAKINAGLLSLEESLNAIEQLPDAEALIAAREAAESAAVTSTQAASATDIDRIAAQAARDEAVASATSISLEVENFPDLATLTPLDLALNAWVLVRTSGHRFKRVASGGKLDYTGTGGVMLQPVDLKKLSQLVDIATATQTETSLKLQSLLTDGGGLVTLPRGTMKTDSTVTADYSASGFFLAHDESSRVSIEGEGHSHTLWKYSGAGAALSLIGTGPTPPMGQGVVSNDRFGGFTIEPFSELALRTPGTIGLSVTRKAYSEFHRMFIRGFATGIYGNGMLTSQFDNIAVQENDIGMRFVATLPTDSKTNAMSFTNCRLSSNTIWGLLGEKWGASNSIKGVTCEYNGTHGDLNTGGMAFNLTADNGITSMEIANCYFEGNGGGADIYLDNTTTSPLVVNIIGCQFHRVYAAKHTLSNISANSSGGGRLVVNLIGCGFLSDVVQPGPYVPSVDRPFWLTSGNVEVNHIGCVFSETISLPVRSGRMGRIDAAGAQMGGNSRGINVTNPIPGVLRVTSNTNFGPTADHFIVNAMIIDGRDTHRIDRVVYNAANQFDVVTKVIATGAYSNAAISWQVEEWV